MADIKINVKTEGGEETINSITSIKKQIKDLRSQALAVGEGGKGFKQLTQQANELQDKLDDLKDSAKSLQGTGIEKLKSSFGLLTESFKNADFGKAKTAFQGLGSAMKAIPIFLIIEGIQYLVENFEKLSQGSGFLAKALQFVGDIITKVTEGITWLLNKLGLVNAELDKKSENLTKNAEKGKKAIEEQNTAYDQQIALLKAQGKSTVDLEIAKQDAIIATNKALVQQTIDFVRSGGVLNAEQKEVLTQQLKAIKQASVDKLVIDTTEKTRLAESNKKATAEHKKKIEDEKNAEIARFNDYNTRALAEIEALKKANADKKAIEDKARDDEKLADIAAQDESLARLNKSRLDKAQLNLLNNKNSLDAQIEYLREQKRIEIQAAKEAGNDIALINKKYADLEDGATEAHFQKKVANVNKWVQAVGSALNSVIGIFSAINDLQKQEAEQDTKERQERLDVQLGALTSARDAELEKEGLTAEQKKDINFKYAQQEYDLKLLEYKRNTEVKKKAFEQDKKLKIAQTVISTITGAVAALVGSIQSLGMPYGAIFGAIAAAAVVATGAVQVAAISKQKFDAGSPPSPPSLSLSSPSDVSSGAGGNGGGAQAGPNLYAAGQGDVNTGQGGPNGQRQSQPQKVYVVSQEVTSSQNINAVIERRSSF